MQMRSTFCQAAAAARRGTSHVLRGIPCQDAVCLQHGTDVVTGEPVSAAVLCDGAGSAALSHQGAAAVSLAVAQLLIRQFSVLGESSLSAARAAVLQCTKQALAREAAQLGCLPHQLASTLVAAAINEKNGTLLTIHLGDGVILGLDRRGKALCLSSPDNGRFSNETWFTTSREAARHLRIGWYDLQEEGCIAVYLSSDGLPLCRADGAPLPGLEMRLARLAVLAPQAAEWYLERMFDCESNYSDDDLSMICLAAQDACFALEPPTLRALGVPAFSPKCSQLLYLLKTQQRCSTVQAARLLHTHPRRVHIWHEKLTRQLLVP